MGTMEGWTTRKANEAAALASREEHGYRRGVREERERVRRELLVWSEDFMRRGAYMDSFREALDRICPEQPQSQSEEPGMFEGQRFGVGKRP